MSRATTALRLAITSPREFVRVVRFRNGPPRLHALEVLVAKSAPRTIVEIGVWRGDASLRMIRAATRRRPDVAFWGFDLFAEGMTPEVLRREVSLQPLSTNEVGSRLEGLGAEVHLIAGNSADTVPRTTLPPVDFAFIDGGHSYETVAADWRNLKVKLAPNALVVFDDYTNQAAVDHEGYGVRRLVDELRSDYRVELLRPIDTFPRAYGSLATRLALLRLNAAVIA